MLLFAYILLVYIENCVAVGIVTPNKLNSSLQIEISNGLIQGKEDKTINGITYFSFLGIPYAKPPINDLRFRSPKPMPRWSVVLDATVMGSCCAGLNTAELSSLNIASTGSEDCLYLNLYTPKIPPKGKNKKDLAVMVFFHGGGFFAGCNDEYGADFLIENNVILVIPNFRVSVFGYLSTNDLECPGNWAAKDQIMVLKWIKFNIHLFGGDPNKVTIFGQSAGAANVNTLLMSRQTKNLFHRAIMMSGSSLSHWSHQTQPRKVAFDLGVAVGIETNNSKILLDELRKIDSKTLLDGQLNTIMINFPSTITTGGLPVTPTVEPVHDEAVITKYPYNILKEGVFNRVPVMIGVTSMEFAFFRAVIRMFKPLMAIFNISPGMFVRITNNYQNKRIVAEKIFNHFFGTTDATKATEKQLMKLESEDCYYRPSRKAASLISNFSPVYFYYFSYEGNRGIQLINEVNNEANRKIRDFKGVAHSEELAYLFTAGRYKLETNKEDLKMSTKISRIFSNFAKIGNPTPIRDPVLDNTTWPRVTPQKFPFMDLGKYFAEVSDNFDEKNFQFWEELYKTYADKPYIVY